MKAIRILVKYFYGVISGSFALIPVYLYDGGIRLPYFETKSGLAIFQMTFNLGIIDFYFLVNLLLVLPLIRMVSLYSYNKKPIKLETYKDKALKLHHSDAQANHKDRAWSANGVTVNPWEYMNASTQSYEGISDSFFNCVKHFFVNVLMLLFGPIFLVYFLTKNRKKVKLVGFMSNGKKDD